MVRQCTVERPSFALSHNVRKKFHHHSIKFHLFSIWQRDACYDKSFFLSALTPRPRSFDSLCSRSCARVETAKIEARRAKLRIHDTRRYSCECHHGQHDTPRLGLRLLERTPTRAHTLSVPLPHSSRHEHTGVGIQEPPTASWS